MTQNTDELNSCFLSLDEYGQINAVNILKALKFAQDVNDKKEAAKKEADRKEAKDEDKKQSQDKN